MPRPANISFGEHLKAWRHDRGLSQATLAKLLDVSAPTINYWESGHAPRDLEEVEERIRMLQLARGEPNPPIRDQIRTLWK